jgi:hypothetical protein
MVDNSCRGKNAWHKEWRAVVFWWLDLSKIQWNEQDPGDVASAVGDMNDRWEYVGPSPRVAKSLEKYGRVIMKTERHRLKKKWESLGADPNMAPPEHCSMTAEQWARLVRIFQSENAKSKSEAMTEARQEVKGANPYGCIGVAGTAAKLKVKHGSTPSKADMKAATRQSGASDISDCTKVHIFDLELTIDFGWIIEWCSF